MIDIKKILGENLKNYRKLLNLSQEELSEKLNISVNHLSYIETGKRFISSDLLEKIYEEMNINPSALFYSPDIKKSDIPQIDLIESAIDSKVAELKDELRKIVG